MTRKRQGKGQEHAEECILQALWQARDTVAAEEALGAGKQQGPRTGMSQKTSGESPLVCPHARCLRQGASHPAIPVRQRPKAPDFTRGLTNSETAKCPAPAPTAHDPRSTNANGKQCHLPPAHLATRASPGELPGHRCKAVCALSQTRPCTVGIPTHPVITASLVVHCALTTPPLARRRYRTIASASGTSKRIRRSEPIAHLLKRLRLAWPGVPPKHMGQANHISQMPAGACPPIRPHKLHTTAAPQNRCCTPLPLGPQAGASAACGLCCRLPLPLLHAGAAGSSGGRQGLVGEGVEQGEEGTAQHQHDGRSGIALGAGRQQGRRHVHGMCQRSAQGVVPPWGGGGRRCSRRTYTGGTSASLCWGVGPAGTWLHGWRHAAQKSGVALERKQDR